MKDDNRTPFGGNLSKFVKICEKNVYEMTPNNVIKIIK